MNRINIVNHIITKSLDKKVKLESISDYIPKYIITFCKDTSLELNLEDMDSKYTIEITVLDGVEGNLTIKKTSKKSKVLFNYILNSNSVLNVIEYQDVDTTNEKKMISLNGEYAKINHILKTISTSQEKYDFMITHNSLNTTSNITNHGINMQNGTLAFTVTTEIPSGKIGCVANQNNRIINLNDKTCLIRPNLLIDEYDVTANHSAYIGNFKDETLFYLLKTGIPKDAAIKLLIEGFMKSNVDPDMINTIYTKYWR